MFSDSHHAVAGCTLASRLSEDAAASIVIQQGETSEALQPRTKD